MENSSVMGMVAIIVSVGGVFFGIINHKRMRSKCCGRVAEVSLDIDNTASVKPDSPRTATVVEVKPA
jgi:hypothetical protein